MVTAVGNGEAILTAHVCGATFLAKGYFTPNFVVSYPALGDDAWPCFFLLASTTHLWGSSLSMPGPQDRRHQPAVASDGVGITPAHEADHGTGSRVAAAVMGGTAPRRWCRSPAAGTTPRRRGGGAMRGPRTVMAGSAGRAAAAAPGVSAGVRQQRGAGRPPGEMISGAPGSRTGRSRRWAEVCRECCQGARPPPPPSPFISAPLRQAEVRRAGVSRVTCRGVLHLRSLAGPGRAGRGERSAGGARESGLGWPLPPAPRPPRQGGVRPHPRPGQCPGPPLPWRCAGPAGWRAVGGRRRLGGAMGPARLPRARPSPAPRASPALRGACGTPSSVRVVAHATPCWPGPPIFCGVFCCSVEIYVL